ncbi:MAG: metal ABC transporter permease, partial [Actinomycetota bacterium]
MTTLWDSVWGACPFGFCQFGFMQRALVAAALVGLAAPAIGIFLVQRRLSLMGDGIGHVAFTGVAAGFLFNVLPLVTAIIAAVVGAVVIELLREKGRTQGDVALAVVFYGGIAGGALLMALA